MEQNIFSHYKNQHYKIANYEQFICIALLVKKSVFAEWNIRSLKNIIHRYLEEKWTYFYIDNLEDFVKSINSRANRVTKLAPNKVTKNDVLRLLSLSF